MANSQVKKRHVRSELHGNIRIGKMPCEASLHYDIYIYIYTIFPIFSNHSNLYIEESQIGKVHAGKAVGGTWVKDPCPHKGSNNLC